MLFKWIEKILSGFANVEPEVTDLETYEAIELVIYHYSAIPVTKWNSMFFKYTYPCKTFLEFIDILEDFLLSVKKRKTPRTVRLQKIVLETNYYNHYFKYRSDNIISRQSAKDSILNLLRELAYEIRVIETSNEMFGNYYNARADIVLDHCVSILETITHE